VARTSAFALNNATLPFTPAMADRGVEAALHNDPHLLAGLNIFRGQVTYRAVAEATGLTYTEPGRALGGRSRST